MLERSMLRIVPGYTDAAPASMRARGPVALLKQHGRGVPPGTRQIYQTMACGVMVIDETGSIVDANEAMQELLGRQIERVRVHAHASEAQAWERSLALTDEDGAPLPRAEQPWTRALRTGSAVRAALIGLTRPDGTSRWLHVDAIPVPGDAYAAAHVVVSAMDVTEYKRAEEMLRHQALHDALTGLPNRVLLYDRLEQALHAAQRELAAVALLLIDLNGFKRINDSQGHCYGDLLLQQVGQRIQSVLRASDTVARLGGDEFAVLLPATEADGAARAARTILSALSQPFVVDGHALSVGASIGIALAPDHGPDAATVLHHADLAMYTAKRSAKKARGGYAFYVDTQDNHDQPAVPTLLNGVNSVSKASNL